MTKAKQYKVNSKTLGVLDALGIEYTIKHANAKLKVWDSLNIQLGGKYTDYWIRWSRPGVHGRDHISLVNYMVSEGLITETDAKRVLGNAVSAKSITVKPSEAYDFKNMVTNPRTGEIEKYLTNVRKLSPVLVKRFIDKDLIVCDGRGNIRFLWKDKFNKLVGAEVQGIEFDTEKYGKRGTLKITLPGSKLFFNVMSSDIKDFSEVENIYLTEATIDLMSMIELGAISNEAREESSYEFPTLKPKSLYVSIAGSATKIMQTVDQLSSEFNIDLGKLNSIVVATDNDESGNEAFTILKDEYKLKNLERLVPNDNQTVLFGGVVTKIKDWNDLLKAVKSEDN